MTKSVLHALEWMTYQPRDTLLKMLVTFCRDDNGLYAAVQQSFVRVVGFSIYEDGWYPTLKQIDSAIALEIETGFCQRYYDEAPACCKAGH